MKYLITGGAGFIGTNFASKLLSRGDSVMIIDNLSKKGSEINLSMLKRKFPKLKYQNVDISTHSEQLLTLVNKSDVVFHLAAQTAVTLSITDPIRDFNTNVKGTINLLEAIRLSTSKPSLIYASTNKVYGDLNSIQIIENETSYEFKSDNLGVTEEQKLDFITPYSCSKGAADQYVLDYSRTYDLNTVVMRQSCIYGPYQFGNEDQGWVAWLLYATLNNIGITIYGNGKQTRDLLHVDDLFTAWDNAVKKMLTVSGEAFNIGGGRENTYSLLNILSYISQNIKTPLYTFGDERLGDQKIFISDNSNAKRLLDWEPRIKLEEGFRSMQSWMVNREFLN